MADEKMVVHGGNLCDVASGKSYRHDVLIVNGRIKRISENMDPPPDAQLVDASGLYVAPGLIDAHTHVTAGSADLGSQANDSPFYVAAQTGGILRDMLGRGFTTVRDVGGADFGVAAAVDKGLWKGPRVYFGGKALSPTGGHGDTRSVGQTILDNHPCCPNISRVCDGVDGVRRAARDQLRTGAHHIKLMLSGGVASPTDRIESLQFSSDEIRAAVEEAENAGRYATGHAYTAAAVNRGLELGVRCIEHGNLIDDDSVQLFVEKDAYLVPTLVTYEYLSSEGAAAGLPPASQAKVDKVLHAGLSALERAWRGGVKVVFGTDLLGSMHRHQSDEFRIRAKVLPPDEILRSATTVAAELLGRSGELGTIAEGAIADLIITDGNPLDDTSVLSQPEHHLRTVIQAGHIVSEEPA